VWNSRYQCCNLIAVYHSLYKQHLTGNSSWQVWFTSLPCTIPYISNISLEIPPDKFGSPSASCLTTSTSWCESGSQSRHCRCLETKPKNKKGKSTDWLLLLLMNYDRLKQRMSLVQKGKSILANFEGFQLNTEFMQKKPIGNFFEVQLGILNRNWTLQVFHNLDSIWVINLQCNIPTIMDVKYLLRNHRVIMCSSGQPTTLPQSLQATDLNNSDPTAVQDVSSFIPKETENLILL